MYDTIPTAAHSIQIRESNARCSATAMTDGTVQFTFIRKALPNENVKDMGQEFAKVIDSAVAKRRSRFTFIPLRVTHDRLISLFRLAIHMLLFKGVSKAELHAFIDLVALNDEELNSRK
jgi:hypothetical protein